MPSSWSHPRLGLLKHDDICWRREIVIPSLQSFTYIDAAVRPYRSHSEPFELVLECESEDEQPDEEMATLAVAVLDNESRLVSKVLEAIWADLNGLGPESGMWWHGDLPNAYRGGNWASFAHDMLTRLDLPVPTCPDDLTGVLEPRELTIRRSPASPVRCIAEFKFHAGFDVEHGVGVLTDGAQILGIGYASDASLFER